MDRAMSLIQKMYINLLPLSNIYQNQEIFIMKSKKHLIVILSSVLFLFYTVYNSSNKKSIETKKNVDYYKENTIDVKAEKKLTSSIDNKKGIKIIGKWDNSISIMTLFKESEKIYMHYNVYTDNEEDDDPIEFTIIKDNGKDLFFDKGDLEFAIKLENLNLKNPDHFEYIKMICWQYVIEKNGYLTQRNGKDIFESYPPVE